jgi:hypothetical protein
MLSEFMCNNRIEAPEPAWELRPVLTMVITNTEVVRSRHAELVMLVGSDLHSGWNGQPGTNNHAMTMSEVVSSIIIATLLCI